jgi:hypothetical protein
MKKPAYLRHYGCRPRQCQAGRRRTVLVTAEESRKEGNGTTVIGAIREYLSDILGAFMPGVYFSVHLIASAVLFWFMINGLSWECFIQLVTKDVPVLSLAAPFGVFVFCLFSYIIGSAFYRKDIKEPDMASAIETYRKTGETEREGLAFDIEQDETAEKTEGGPPRKTLWGFFKNAAGRFAGLFKREKFLVDFPYLYLKRYLKHRKYTGLADRIPWDGTDRNTFKRRSKMFINRLKSRIHQITPGEMPGIEKNEAHIRLMNSLWYAAKSIRNISVPVLLAGVLFCIRDFIPAFRHIIAGNGGSNYFTSFLVFFSVIQLGIATYIRRSIKQYFHYMRVREIMFILEIADTIDRTTDIDMFAGLSEPE